MCGGAPHQISDGIHAHHAQHTLVVAMPAVLGALMLRRRACIGQQPTVLVEARGEPVSHERDGPAYIHDSQCQVLYRFRRACSSCCVRPQTGLQVSRSDVACTHRPQAQDDARVAGTRQHPRRRQLGLCLQLRANHPVEAQQLHLGAMDACTYLLTFIMIRTEDGLNRNVRESQSLIRYLS
jgi:hypothetical protein